MADDAAPSTAVAYRLTEAGWGPRDLARAVNAWLQRTGRSGERVDLTAPYSWVRFGFCPHEPLPTVVADVLTERLGRLVHPADLWPEHPRVRGRTWEGAAASTILNRCTSLDDTLRVLSTLSTTRQPRTALAGVDLVTAVLDGLQMTTKWATPRDGLDRVLHPQADLIAAHVEALRRLDDRQGGGALSLRYVIAELAAVLDLIRCASYDMTVGRRLLTSVADLAQLTGFLSAEPVSA